MLFAVVSYSYHRRPTHGTIIIAVRKSHDARFSRPCFITPPYHAISLALPDTRARREAEESDNAMII